MTEGKNHPINTKFQRKARSGKEMYLNKEYKEIEDNDQMESTARDFFKNICEIKGNLHKDKMIKDKKTPDQC